MKKRGWLLIIPVFVLSIVLGACGGSGDASNSDEKVITYALWTKNRPPFINN
ncbi:hypothetical protein [Listeria fleischmannii]|uniref:hypothetical protein n=1 Tax=Listeria fleischmannii TaxID=1069827 RepID=UPI001C3F508A|nr:hypothetical protein [Listeria fleischmannii]